MYLLKATGNIEIWISEQEAGVVKQALGSGAEAVSIQGNWISTRAIQGILTEQVAKETEMRKRGLHQTSQGWLTRNEATGLKPYVPSPRQDQPKRLTFTAPQDETEPR